MNLAPAVLAPAVLALAVAAAATHAVAGEARPFFSDSDVAGLYEQGRVREDRFAGYDHVCFKGPTDGGDSMGCDLGVDEIGLVKDGVCEVASIANVGAIAEEEQGYACLGVEKGFQIILADPDGKPLLRLWPYDEAWGVR